MSRLRKEIERQLADAGTSASHRLGRLRLAAYLARSGALGEAREILDSFRSGLERYPSSNELTLLNVAEALLAFYDGKRCEAIDKIRRAQAIGLAGKAQDDLLAIAASWDAHFQRNEGRIFDLVAALTRGIAHCSEQSSEALGRLSLVTADAFQEASDGVSALKWYRAAHTHALACGDDSLLAAMLYNRAALRLYGARIELATGSASSVEDYASPLEEASARNYEALMRTHSLSWLLDVVRGELHMLQGRYDEALGLFEAINVKNNAAGFPEGVPVRKADVVFCRAKLGILNEPDEIEQIVREVERLNLAGDQILVWDRLLGAARSLGDDRLAAESRYHIDSLKPKYEAARVGWLAKLSDLTDSLSEFQRGCIFGRQSGPPPESHP